MRIDLLMDREPFGSILAATLCRFWQQRYGEAFHVGWQPSRRQPSGRQPSANGDPAQIWSCNAWLNVLFTRDVAAKCFEPIRREYSYTTVRWRRTWQRAYVHWALHRGIARLLRHGTLQVSPAVPDDRHQIVVAGNHKIRVLDFSQDCAYAIRKHEFPKVFLQAEIEARQLARQHGVRTPEISEIGPDQDWYREAMLIGTPSNRLADTRRGESAQRSALDQLRQLATATCQEVDRSGYVQLLCQRTLPQLRELSGASGEKVADQWTQFAEDLMHHTLGTSPLTVAATHGDFQPANVLVDDSQQVWLIDWEYAETRQSVYDLISAEVLPRADGHWPTRLKQFMDRGPVRTAANWKGWPGACLDSFPWRGWHARLFLMEELALQSRENDNRQFVRPGTGWWHAVDALDTWSRMGRLP